VRRNNWFKRLAPLGAVTIGGLIIKTFMTFVFIPTVFIWKINEDKLHKENTNAI
jgi:Cu/Ag efflux pump CusA